MFRGTASNLAVLSMAGIGFPELFPNLAMLRCSGDSPSLEVRIDRGRRQRLDPLGCVARRPPRRIGQCGERLGPRPGPRRRHIRLERIEIAECEVRRDGTVKRGVSRSPARTRRPRQRDERIRPHLPRRARPEHMQPVADLHLLEVAEIGVERLERLARHVREPEVAVEPGGGRGGDDLPLEIVLPTPIHAGGKRVFVDHRLERRERAVELRPGHRRHQVVDDHRRCPPLGLRPFAGIVDDERVDQRQRPEAQLRPAFGRERQRLAGQPFEAAVLAEMDDRVGGEHVVEPGVERDVVVRRHEFAVMEARLLLPAPRRLHGHRDVAVADGADGVIAGRSAPTRGQRGARRLRHAGEKRRIEVAIDPRPRLRLQRRDQRRAVIGKRSDVVPGAPHRRREHHGRRRGVEADGVADPARPVGIVGEHDSDAAVLRRLRP